MSEELECDGMSVRSAALYLSLFSCCLHCCAAAARLAPPHNVTMITLNTNYVLSWKYDSNISNSHSLTFTTQYLPKFKLNSKKKKPNWNMACNQTSQRFCDLTVFNLHYLGIYALRVRANMNGIHSDWEQMEFCPDKDAAVGPPTLVRLVPVGSDLQVSISDPLTTNNSSMKELVSKLYYNIRYWERSRDASGLMMSSQTNTVILPNLKAWTWYCVSLQSYYDFYNKRSSFTTPHCMQTEGAVPWWQIFLYFLASLMICFLLILLVLCGFFWVCKTFKATFYPSNKMPTHFHQYGLDSPGSDIPPLFTPDSESVLCEKVILCPQPGLLEEEIPSDEELLEHRADLPSDSSGELSCQVSSSSGDTGIYSAEGCSSLYQPDSAQSVPGSSDCCRVSFEQVKMKEIKNEASIVSDVVDMWI